jgi:hypothetical protein
MSDEYVYLYYYWRISCFLVKLKPKFSLQTYKITQKNVKKLTYHGFLKVEHTIQIIAFRIRMLSLISIWHRLDFLRSIECY